MKKRLGLLLVDFDGVMSNSRFYETDALEDREFSDKAKEFIFSQENTVVLNSWMRGAICYQEVHRLAEQAKGLSAKRLDHLLHQSVINMDLNKLMLSYVKYLRENGVTVGLFTNNMDVFDSISRYHFNLDKYFNHIYSSSAYGQLKLENDTIIRKVIDDTHVHIDEVALVDDSQSSFDTATKYGIATFLYRNYKESQVEFETWIEKNYSLTD
ncbi:MAG: hypothetical protein EOL95_12135 [Bacteroidia bacterium]|nr:hypothetical protein [Bacteroidia bacterium]NCU30798.1 hypothetical protein [Candidatus Saccharibacteria bacterium]